MEVKLIDITKADQEGADCEEVIEVAAAQGEAVVGTLEEPTTPRATTTDTTTEVTETIGVEAPAAAPLSPLKGRGCHATSKLELIPINRDSFSISNGPKSQQPGIRAESRAVKTVVNAVLDGSHTLEQQVYALHHAVKHSKMKLVSASAGVFVGKVERM